LLYNLFEDLLDKRRIRSDLVEHLMILNGLYNINKGSFFGLDDGGRRGNGKKLFKRRFRFDTVKFVFSNRVVDNNGIHYLHSVPIAAPLTRSRSIFQFNRSRNPIIIVNKCDIVESRRYRH